MPVTVYQFNALDYYLPRDCPESDTDDPGDGACYSFTNDASLLLPTHVLTGSYVAIARPTLMVGGDGMFGGSPGYVTLIGVDETPTEVEVRLSAAVTDPADPEGPPLARGTTQTFTLARGEVVQLVGAVPASCTGPIREETVSGGTIQYCELGPGDDLTGTEIRAAGRVSVISGHNCAFVPFQRWACDHLEEQMFPIESWGRDVVISTTLPIRTGEPNLVRVVAAHDDTTVTFTPEAVQAPRTLARGEHFELELREDVRITGSQPIAVAQFVVGQDFGGYGSSGFRAVGDPSMGLAIPSEQFRTQYTFLAPTSYPESRLNVVAPSGAEIVLDGRRIRGFADIPETTFSTRRLEIPSGVHTMEGSAPFGIIVYGFGTYTSYLYAGGLDFREIAPPF